METKNKTVILTGAAGEFGQSIFDYLHAQEFTVISIDKRKIDNRANCFQADLTSEDDVKNLFSKIENKFGAVHMLINNAGFIYSKPLVNLFDKENPIHSLEAFNNCVSSNLTSTFLMGAYTANLMIKKRIKGVIVNISSISAQGNAGQSAYSAAKAAIIGLTKTWAKELGVFGIRSIAISPGFIETKSTHSALSEAAIKHIKKNTPLRKLGSTNNVCETILFAYNNTFLNGDVLSIDGGLTI